MNPDISNTPSLTPPPPQSLNVDGSQIAAQLSSVGASGKALTGAGSSTAVDTIGTASTQDSIGPFVVQLKTALSDFVSTDPSNPVIPVTEALINLVVEAMQSGAIAGSGISTGATHKIQDANDITLGNSSASATQNSSLSTQGNPWLAGTKYTEFLIDFMEMFRTMKEITLLQAKITSLTMGLIYAIAKATQTSIMDKAYQQFIIDIAGAVAAGITIIASVGLAYASVSASSAAAAQHQAAMGELKAPTPPTPLTPQNMTPENMAAAKPIEPTTLKTNYPEGQSNVVTQEQALKNGQINAENQAYNNRQTVNYEEQKVAYTKATTPTTSGGTVGTKPATYNEADIKAYNDMRTANYQTESKVYTERSAQATAAAAANTAKAGVYSNMQMAVGCISPMISQSFQAAGAIPIATQEGLQAILQAAGQIANQQMSTASQAVNNAQEFITNLLQTLDKVREGLRDAVAGALSAR